MTISKRIDVVTEIPVSYRHAFLPAPQSLKIEITSRCNLSCLRGDTLVDTIYGRIPIAELAAKYSTVPVYTYKDGRVFVADAVNIMKTRSNANLVRVSFDDGTHIDCTPDHKFLQFRLNGRKAVEEVTEAQDMAPGTRVRAYRENVTGVDGRITICWGRNFRQKRARMIAEYMLKRPIERVEHVHHKDGNPINDAPDNLEVFANAREHFASHPELAERMRRDNPVFKMTPEQRSENSRKNSSGKVRTLEQRLRYRESKIGEKNPNYVDGASAKDRRSRIEDFASEVNHKVVSVTPLEEVEDVYCLEVPETGWFFANQVLVKNCSFCVKSLIEDDQDMDRALYSRVIREAHDFGVKELGVFFVGESFTCKWLPAAIKEAKEVGFEYVFLTTNGGAANERSLYECMAAGLDSLKFSLNFYSEDQFAEIARAPRPLWRRAIENVKAARRIKDDHDFKCGIYASSIAFDGEQGKKMQAVIDEVRPYLNEHYFLPLFGMNGASSASGMSPGAGNPGRLANMRPPLPCWAVSREAHVDRKGRLIACCFGDSPDGGLAMADLNEVSFREGWNSPEFMDLRRAHLKKDVTGTACEKCIAA